MAMKQFKREVFWGDRWPVPIYSPRSFSDIDTTDRKVLIGPGWGKHPNRLGDLMLKLADAGTFPIGVDLRWTYANKRSLQPVNSTHDAFNKMLRQSYSVGNSNQFLGSVGAEANRYQWRRPTALLALCEALGLADIDFVGHSESGRVGTLAAKVRPELFGSLVLINAAGLSTSPSPTVSMVRSNIVRAGEMVRNPETRQAIILGAADATLHTIPHPRRILREKEVILTTDLWSDIDELTETAPDINVHVLHAIDDSLVPHGPSEQRAREHPHVNFIPTEGEHYNIYIPEIQDLIVRTLTV
jgi:hypothetical protein